VTKIRCSVCDIDFLVTQSNHKVCSEACRLIHTKLQRKQYYSLNSKKIITRVSSNKKIRHIPNACQICAKIFLGRKSTTCCSNECRLIKNNNNGKNNYKKNKHNAICTLCQNTFLSNSNNQKECKKCTFLKLDLSSLSVRKEKRRVYIRSKYNNDLNFRLSDILRSRLNKAIKGIRRGSAVKDLGCSIEELKVYLESKFLPEMTWNNYGKYGWHIDHIKPLSGFNLSNIEQLKEACHYTNLQPLWAKDNLSKGSKY
jgi:hypothetical protein